jgi:hypothetical protein
MESLDQSIFGLLFSAPFVLVLSKFVLLYHLSGNNEIIFRYLYN